MMGQPPIQGAGIRPGRGRPGRLGGGGIPAPAGGGAEDGVGGLSLLKCCGGFVSQALSLSFHPFLIVVLHILFGFPTNAVCLSQMERHGEVCMAGLSNKTWACCCAGRWPLCSMPLELTQLLYF